MTVQVDLITLIILVVVIFLVAFLLPMAWQFKKTAEQAEALLDELRRELVPTLRELRETGQHINRISMTVAKGIDKAESLLDSVDGIVDSVDHLGKFMQQDIFRIASYAECLISGIRAAGKVLFKETQNKEIDS
jgi:uncharacterized protein YoxC